MRNFHSEIDAFEAESSLTYQRPFQLTFAQEREVMEAMASGSLAKRFHAVQHVSTMALQVSKTLIASQFARS